MTLFQVEELTSYWTRYPPLHLSIAAYLGVVRDRHRRPPPVSARDARSDAASMLAQLGPGFGAGDVHVGLSPVILDFAELSRRAVIPD